MNKRNKIVHLANVDQSISLFLMPQLKALQELGYEVHSISPLKDNKDEILKNGIIAHHVNVTRDITFWSDMIMFFNIWRIMMRERFLLVHAHSAKMEFFAQLAARMAFVPIVVYTNHGMIFRSRMSGMKKKVLRAMASFSGMITDHIFSQSQEDINFAIEHKIYPKRKLSYLGNGIDIENFNIDRFPKEKINSIKKELGIPESSPVVGLVARFVKEKGYDEFFRAAKKILEHKSDVYFLCVGNDVKNERDPVDFDLLEEMGINGKFIVLRSQKDMARLYAVMDVVTLPSYREGFPRTLMEAASMSKPTVGTNISGCREAIEHGENGILVEVGDDHGLFEAILRILNDPDLTTHFKQQGRIKAENQFDQRKVVERLIEGYNRLLS